jgi:DHA1 family bicyclomycin/chloramphenicol resistance-like MFS transporter
MACATLFYGALADRYGRRPVLLIGLALFVSGSAASAVAPSFIVLLGGRVLQSVGAGCGITLARAIARDLYGANAMVRAIAYLTMFFALGALVAPGFGGMLIDQGGWRAVFYFATACGTAMAIAALLFVPETGKGTAATTSASGWRGLFELLKHPRFCALIVHTGCSTGTFLVVATASSSLMKDALHRSATEFGLYFAMVPFGFVTGTFIASRIGNRIAVEKMIIVGGCIAVLAVSVQSGLLLAGHFVPLVLFLPGTFITLAQGLSLPFAQAGAMATIPRLAGTAAGLGVFAQNFLGAGFSQIYGLLADGTPAPMMTMTAITASLGMMTAIIPSLLDRHAPGVNKP